MKENNSPEDHPATVIGSEQGAQVIGSSTAEVQVPHGRKQGVVNVSGVFDVVIPNGIANVEFTQLEPNGEANERNTFEPSGLINTFISLRSFGSFTSNNFRGHNSF